MNPRKSRSWMTACAALAPCYSILGLWAVSHALLPFAIAAPDDGLILHSQNTTTGEMVRGSVVSTSRSYFTDRHIRIDSGYDQDYIVTVASRILTTLNHRNQTYTAVNLDELQEKFERMAEQMKQNPVAIQMLEKMGLGSGAAAPTLTPEGSGPQIAGYRTRKYRIRIPPMIEAEIWAAPELTAPGGYYEALRMRSPGAPTFDVGPLFDLMKQIEGITLKSVTRFAFLGQTLTSTQEVTQVERKEVPESTFQIPDGYQKIAFEFGP